jgi:hypothetical protein
MAEQVSMLSEAAKPPDNRTTADAGIPLLLHIERPWPRAAECGHSAISHSDNW